MPVDGALPVLAASCSKPLPRHLVYKPPKAAVYCPPERLQVLPPSPEHLVLKGRDKSDQPTAAQNLRTSCSSDCFHLQSPPLKRVPNEREGEEAVQLFQPQNPLVDGDAKEHPDMLVQLMEFSPQFRPDCLVLDQGDEVPVNRASPNLSMHCMKILSFFFLLVCPYRPDQLFYQYFSVATVKVSLHPLPHSRYILVLTFACGQYARFGFSLTRKSAGRNCKVPLSFGPFSAQTLCSLCSLSSFSCRFTDIQLLFSATACAELPRILATLMETFLCLLRPLPPARALQEVGDTLAKLFDIV